MEAIEEACPVLRRKKERMAPDRRQAVAEFRRIMIWIAVIAVLMVIIALTYLHFTSSLDANTVIATTLGVFFSVLLGCGLFAAAFFSSKSGYDQNVTDVTKSERDKN
jgi:uncharacterized oligopeptide transporter (OPT) family protein